MEKQTVKETAEKSAPDPVADAIQNNAVAETGDVPEEPSPTADQATGQITGPTDDATHEDDGADQPAPPANEPPHGTLMPQAPDYSHSTLEAQLAEAEQRGYLRGRNESIAELMRQPGVFERMPDARTPDTDGTDSEIMVLTRERVSIWDK